jgi:hypothetical protein
VADALARVLPPDVIARLREETEFLDGLVADGACSLAEARDAMVRAIELAHATELGHLTEAHGEQLMAQFALGQRGKVRAQ